MSVLGAPSSSARAAEPSSALGFGRTSALAAALALALSASACSGDLHALGSEESPLFVVRGRGVGPVPPRVTHLRAGLVWAGVPVFVPFCHDYGPSSLSGRRGVGNVGVNGCRDPFEVVPALVGPSVPVGDDLTFEIPIAHLPDASVMVGALPGRVAYATVVLFDDLNDDGVLEFAPPCGPADSALDQTREVETIYASSFTTLARAQTRVTYVEGPFDADGYYYPHPRCTALPPRGFSLWSVGSLLGASDTCRLLDPDAELEVPFAEAYQLAHLSCPQSPTEGLTRPPLSDPIGAGVQGQCTPSGANAYTNPWCPCPNVRVYALSGCYADTTCTTPDWDVPPPPGWPCPPEGP